MTKNAVTQNKKMTHELEGDLMIKTPAPDKRIAYDYSFNYFGGDTYDGKIVNGASISLNIRPYKKGMEILFADGDEVAAADKYLNNVYKVSFDREKQFVIEKNLLMDNLFRRFYGWDRIHADVIRYSLDVITGQVKDEANDLPSQFQNIPVAEPVVVTEEEFRTFLDFHKNDFDIDDNKDAQVPSVIFYDVP